VRRPVALVTVAALAVLTAPGCKRSEPPPAEDRALQILKREVEREARGEAVGRAPDAPQDPNAQLAELAARREGPKDLPFPTRASIVRVGALSAKLVGLSATHTIDAGKVQLTSEELFVVVTLTVRNEGAARETFDLSLAQIVDRSDGRYPPASDVQRTAGTRQLRIELEPSAATRVRLLFEVPRALVGNGLALLLPAGVAPDATTDVRIPLDDEA
jgi:hypothetical protein